MQALLRDLPALTHLDLSCPALAGDPAADAPPAAALDSLALSAERGDAPDAAAAAQLLAAPRLRRLRVGALCENAFGRSLTAQLLPPTGPPLACLTELDLQALCFTCSESFEPIHSCNGVADLAQALPRLPALRSLRCSAGANNAPGAGGAVTSSFADTAAALAAAGQLQVLSIHWPSSRLQDTDHPILSVFAVMTSLSLGLSGTLQVLRLLGHHDSTDWHAGSWLEASASVLAGFAAGTLKFPALEVLDVSALQPRSPACRQRWLPAALPKLRVLACRAECFEDVAHAAQALPSLQLVLPVSGEGNA